VTRDSPVVVRGDDRGQVTGVAVAVRAQHLAVGYQGRTVIPDIDLVLPAGQALALVGTNGSGKSTLLRTLVGLLPPVAGDVEVLGGTPVRAARRIAYLGQFHQAGGTLPLRARDVVTMGRYPRRGLFGRITRDDRAVVERSMNRLGISDLAHRPLLALSGGQQQRVFLAQLLAREADLLVLDEPTAGLDAAGSTRYLQIVREELDRGATVITATHDIGEAMGCDQAVLLAGRLVAKGRPAEVLDADHLLEAFGVALRLIRHRDHQDLLVPEDPHGHPD
jgi:ABC-type Mn2+/Zn2+ transport system ATPase subunit